MRLPGWRARLIETLAEVKAKPFSWEEQHDCALGLVAPVAKALTGKDFGAEFRGEYTTAKGALKALRKRKYKDLADCMAKTFVEIHPSKAQSGDLVAIGTQDEIGVALGVVIGERIGVLSPTGFATLDRSKAERAFRVE